MRTHILFKQLPLLLLLLPVINTVSAYASNAGKPEREKKNYEASYISMPPKIDGKLDDKVWENLPVAGNFIVYAPYNGSSPANQTRVKLAYDNDAVYIAAEMLDSHPDSICKEFGKRDQVESLNTDYISFDILPYNDGLNMYEFKVTPANLQNDCKYSAIGTDLNWDAVWESATLITDSSWIAEVRIPWSALRFPRIAEQKWGFNLWRNFQRRREFSTWSYIDNQDQDIFKYYGTITGIRNIDPPVRLSITPYVAGYIENSPEVTGWKYSGRGGLDLKWGINESYTVDMMLIPDFGQVQSDDVILNLTPFEVRYDEKRQFFTEGTELFNKCGLFYSRRIGSIPRDFYRPYYEARVNEVINENPEETSILNATKISGRNSKGLGIGFFNAITSPADAKLLDTTDNSSRKIRTQEFTNYNVMVVDQNLKHNSYATIINTNYWMPRNHYHSNVTGAETRLNNKKSSFSFLGRLNVSQVVDQDGKKETGSRYLVSISKPRGKFQYELQRDAMDKRYDPNDMGYISNNNEVNNSLRLSHLVFDPVWIWQSMQSDILMVYKTLSSPNDLISYQLVADNYMTFHNYWADYIEVGVTPDGVTDYYEPRTWGWKYKRPASSYLNWRIASDSRKKFRIHNSFGLSSTPGNSGTGWNIETILRMRFSDRFSVTLTGSYLDSHNDYGWAKTLFDSIQDPIIYFARRNVLTVSNIVNFKYVFNTKSSLNLRGRHYWSRVEFLDYYRLDQEGLLTRNNSINLPNESFNAFSADLQFVWYFAPGSELSMVWKNSINSSDEVIHLGYAEDFANTMRSDQANSFSIRLLYYLDFQSVRKQLKA
ncbi:MAG: carbohydrate binding family 9 domain-containing protein [Bacteroidetes bacterium]|nr:carbohydrate binding family 9 domain-containing protein [Bacteroidota bacterium]